jgi:hypothetical protein
MVDLLCRHGSILLSEDREDFVVANDQVFAARELDLVAGVLAEEHAVSLASFGLVVATAS